MKRRLKIVVGKNNHVVYHKWDDEPFHSQFGQMQRWVARSMEQDPDEWITLYDGEIELNQNWEMPGSPL